MVTQFHNKNQFLITDEHFGYELQSYESKVAFFDRPRDCLVLYKDWNYSKTTMKHVYLFIEQFCPHLTWYKIYTICKNKHACIQNLIDKGYIEYHAI